MVEKLPRNVDDFSSRLAKLQKGRRDVIRNIRKTRGRRVQLTAQQRKRILAKTGRRCHLCGGLIKGKWQADHVFSYCRGGKHSEDNYLPAHELCNNYRWHYTPEEFQHILKLGVWARTQIKKLTPIGRSIGERFLVHERARNRRRQES